MEEPLKINTLGGLVFQQSGEIVTDLPSRKAASNSLKTVGLFACVSTITPLMIGAKFATVVHNISGVTIFEYPSPPKIANFY